MLFTNMVGVDLGTDSIKLRDKSYEKFMEIRNMIAARGNKILAVGDPELAKRVEGYAEELKDMVETKAEKLETIGYKAYLEQM